MKENKKEVSIKADKSISIKENFKLAKPGFLSPNGFFGTLGLIALVIAVFFVVVYFLPAGTVPFLTIPFKNALLDATFWGLLGILLRLLGRKNNNY